MKIKTKVILIKTKFQYLIKELNNSILLLIFLLNFPVIFCTGFYIQFCLKFLSFWISILSYFEGIFK